MRTCSPWRGCGSFSASSGRSEETVADTFDHDGCVGGRCCSWWWADPNDAMIYLSAKGEVLGQFEEDAVPSLLADGTITDAAFYWREGMSEWLPVGDLPKPEVEVEVPLAPPEPEPAVVLPTPVSGGKRPFSPRRGPVAVTGAAAAPIASAVRPAAVARPGSAADKAAPVRPSAGPSAVAGKIAAAQVMRPVGEAAAAAVPRKTGRGWLVGLAGLVLFGAVAGGGVWWWLANAEPPVIPGTVVLAGDESGPVEIRVFRREELVAPWRERLAAADARAAELGGLITEAQALLREKFLLREEAARVFEVGEEYKMPDVEELRADREAKQADADAAQAEVAKLEAEKGSLLTFEGLLENMPAPLQTVVADAGGVFSLPPPEDEEVVLLAMTTVESDGQRQARAWLEVLEVPADGAAPDAVRFSEMNRLDLDEIRRLASAGAP